MTGSPQLVDRRSYPKNIFSRQDVEAERQENLKNHAVSSEISEDADNFILTTTWPSLDSLSPDSTRPSSGPQEADSTPSGSPPTTPPSRALTAGSANSPISNPSPSNDGTAASASQDSGTFTTLKATDLASLRSEYQRLYDVCQTLPQHSAEVAKASARVLVGDSRYQAVSVRLGGIIPWQFIGITHYLEANCSFGRHLHNGDPMMTGPLNSPVWLRTTHVPVDRPEVWPPPDGESDAWLWSAMDAMRGLNFDEQTDWSIPAMLYRFERYNGMGYRQFGNPSPYLWSLSQIYRVGKFTSDGHYDPNVASNECGAALLLKSIL